MTMRRHIAGNVWCSQKRNQNKWPCPSCRGRGTVLHRDGVRRCCARCKLTGWVNFEGYARAALRIFSLWCAYGFDERAVRVYTLSKERGGLFCPYDQLGRKDSQ